LRTLFGTALASPAAHPGCFTAQTKRDPATGKKVWSHDFPKSQLFGSVTATAGDLVLAGGTNDRMFRAQDANTGDVLWEQKTNSGIVGMPVAYEVDGVEYIAV
jgi:alcohol dehydrogenase (cytochrome c)